MDFLSKEDHLFQKYDKGRSIVHEYLRRPSIYHPEKSKPIESIIRK